jgi:hypothetical protein
VKLVVALVAGVLAAAIAVTVVVMGVGRGEERQPPALELPSQIAHDPLRFVEGRRQEYETAAAFGLSHALFAKSPGGVMASVQRVAAFRNLIEEAVSGSDLDPDLVEAIVFLESAGRPEVIAGDDPQNAAGLTQIVAETATNFLGMDVDLVASRRLTRLIDKARRQGNTEVLARLQGERRRVDARFDPAQALAGTVRYLTEAKRVFGREDLAIVSYHMGIGNLASVVRAYTGRANDSVNSVVRDANVDYARLYFDSSPSLHRDAWEQLASLGDDSQTYYWRVLAARDLMRLSREDRNRLARLVELHDHLPNAELVLHPPRPTARFADVQDLKGATARGLLEPLQVTSDSYFGIDPTLERLTRRYGNEGDAYRTLRPRAARLLEYMSAKVYEISHETRPLAVARAAYDESVGEAFTPPDPGATTHAGVHATGFAFDVRRRYGSGAQAEAFQWTLERLQALGLITWTRGQAVIHVTVSPRVDV